MPASWPCQFCIHSINKHSPGGPPDSASFHLISSHLISSHLTNSRLQPSLVAAVRQGHPSQAETDGGVPRAEPFRAVDLARWACGDACCREALTSFVFAILQEWRKTHSTSTQNSHGVSFEIWALWRVIGISSLIVQVQQTAVLESNGSRAFSASGTGHVAIGSKASLCSAAATFVQVRIRSCVSDTVAYSWSTRRDSPAGDNKRITRSFGMAPEE